MSTSPLPQHHPATAAAVPPSPSAVPAVPVKALWPARLGFAAIGLLGILAVLYAWRLPPFASAVVSTENALVRGQMTVIGSQLSGYVVDVRVQDFQRVKQGELLLLIDPRNYQHQYEQALAQLAAQQAALANWPQQRRSAEQEVLRAQAVVASAEALQHRAGADQSRVDRLVADGSLSLREQDQAGATQAQSRAQLSQARAGLEIARQSLQSVIVNRAALEAGVASAAAVAAARKVDLDNTRITAPADGQLGQVSVRRGAFVNAGAQLMGLVPRQMWIIANFKETQIGALEVGQSAPFTVDALDGVHLDGRVELISPATGAEFSVLTPDNATGNFVKIAQRIPVRIAILPDQPAAQRLRPGMSVVVSVDTARRVSAPGAKS